MSRQPYFSLYEYDSAYDIIELEVTSFTFDTASFSSYVRKLSLFDSLRIEQEAGRYPHNIRPPDPFADLVTIEGCIDQSFKGLISNGSIDLRTRRNSGSCGWRPVVGERYLVYLNHSDEGYSNEVGICYRITPQSDTRKMFSDEKELLIALNTTNDGQIHSERLVRFSTDSILFEPFQGAFSNGMRTGEWTISKLEQHGLKSDVSSEVIYRIRYRNGKVVDSGRLTAAEGISVNDFTSWMEKFYQPGTYNH